MFNAYNKIKGAVTLFTAPNSPVSSSLVKLVRARYPHQSPHNYSVEITSSVPTPEQWRIISHSSTVPMTIRQEIAKLAGAPSLNRSTEGNGQATDNESNHIKENKYPMLVDWDTGKVAVNDESLATQILDAKTNKK